jgi:YD repeat-containing protein
MYVYGAENGGTYQDTRLNYDGYGRLQTKHLPEQRDSNNNSTYTTWAYNPDDTVLTVTDARNASATYSYNGRHLVTGITYSTPAGITPTSNVTFGYDAAGNRISMSDGLGGKSYQYDQLSRMSSETRTFNGVGTFALSYEYNFADELTKITSPYGEEFRYNLDSAGRLIEVTGPMNAWSQGPRSYLSNVSYRAWGAIKSSKYLLFVEL